MAGTLDAGHLLAAGIAMGQLERSVHGDEAVTFEEWAELSPERQAKVLSARFVLLETHLADSATDTADPPSFGYDHGRLESGGEWGFD